MLSRANIKFNKIHIAYQSKLGPVQWLKPELETTIKELKNDKVLIYPLSFIIDNSETDFELSIEYKEIADKLNFKEYIISECLNDNNLFVDYLINKI